MGLAHFDLTAEPDGTCTVAINGETVGAKVLAGQLAFAADNVPRLTLRLMGDATLAGDGIVEVAHDPATQLDRPIGDIVADWITGLDPMQLWTMALEGGTMSDHLAPALLNCLADLARQELGQP